MKKTRIAINGFGRIGRLVLRAVYELDRDDIEVVAINDLAPLSTNAHLLKYDSTHRIAPMDISTTGDTLVVNGDSIQSFSERNPEDLPWKDLEIDIVAECTGIFRTKELASKHLTAGAKKVLISAPGGKDIDFTTVFGVNHTHVKPEHTIVSNASCTTNCLAPVVDVLDKAFGVSHGFMTTIHSYTNDQSILDVYHKDLRRARTAAQNMIPTSTGAAAAVGLVLPHLSGKLDGSSVRVPTMDVSLVDLKCVVTKDTTAEDVNAVLKDAANGPLKGILGVEDLPLVSTDFLHDARSSIVDTAETTVIQGNFVRVVSWYDNEWGFSCRMLDTIRIMSSL
ncbi:MAG: type I glyceraldehyde-3-phosphate dehydrogenase [Alphaproteobacteria bacterium]|nr:type I glyceraldehyde-3-phosphate dehydrogenase [Alphaproteobacteria bacterium]MBN2779538.1 type I glyceraldehyde-3-phosphate dehydrogenase [Alphaproteobacteria bacterium]